MQLINSKKIFLKAFTFCLLVVAQNSFAINESSGVRPNCNDDPSTCAGIVNTAPAAAAEIPCQGGPQECGAVVGGQEEMLKDCTPSDGGRTLECEDGTYLRDEPNTLEQISDQLQRIGQ